MARMEPTVAKTAEEAAARAVARLRSRMRPAMDALKRELRSQNRAIDSDASYRRTRARCRKW